MSDAMIIAYEETDNTFPPAHFLVSAETIAKRWQLKLQAMKQQPKQISIHLYCSS